MSTIAVTGISGFLGRRVHERLTAAGHRVVGIDTTPPAATEGLIFREADVRSRADIERAFADVDAVVHLAVSSAAEGAPDPSIDVDGSIVVIDRAIAAHVDTLVVLSSAMVYGATADNPVPLHEDAPLRAGGDFALAAHKREVEEYLAAQDTAVRTVVLRSAMVVGTDAEILLTRALQGNRMLAVRGHHPPQQFVHVDDLAAAVALAIAEPLEGPYNVGAEGWLSFDDTRELLGRRVWEVPEEIAFGVTQRGHALGLSKLPASGLPWVMYPWVVSPQRLIEAGWRPTLSNRDLAALLAAEVQDRIEIAGITTDRRTVARAGVAAAASFGGILALGLLARSRRDTDVEAGADAPGPAAADQPGVDEDEDGNP